MIEDMDTPPTATWDTWRAKLRDIRELAGKTQRAVARASGLGKSTVSAIENGQRMPKRTHAVALDEVLSTAGTLTKLWDDVNGRGATHTPEWWLSALEIEARSQEIWEYEPMIVPGLLQCEEYARAMMEATGTTKVDEKEVRDRLGRVENARRHGCHVRSIVTEHGLTSHPPGLQKIVPRQLDHIQNLIRDELIEVQILPAGSAPLSACLPFRIHILSPSQTVIYTEHLLGGVTKSNPESISYALRLYAQISAESTSPRATIDEIARIRSKWNGAPAPTAEKSETVSKSQSRRSL